MLNDLLYSRRLFLSRGAQLLSAAATLPLFLDRSGQALAADFEANPQGAGRNDRVLVIVQMAGGNDGLNTVIPITNDDYYRVRPTLAIPKAQALRATDDFGFHPSATGFKKMWDDGHLGVLHAVGYPNPNRSHFRSTDIWGTAEPERTGRSGWLGRYFDACCGGEDPTHHSQPTPAQPSAAIALTAEPPTTLIGEKFIPLAFRSPAELAFSEATGNEKIKLAFDRLNSDIGLHDPLNDADHMADPAATIHIPRGTDGSSAPASADDFLHRSALNARVYAETIKKSVAGVQNKVAYPPSPFAAQLKLVAQMIAAGLPTRVYYVQMGGFDTHSGQLQRQVRLMEDLAGSLAAFVDDLKALDHLDRTTVMTFSEFGRRVAQNGSGGTDHGQAAPLFVMGTGIKPGFHGDGPDLRPGKLNQGDVQYKLDFRSLYATMLGQWLKTDDARVLGRKFPRLDLFRAERVEA